MIELLLSQVKGRDINELIAAGMEKMASSVPCGGGGANGDAVAAPAAEAAKKEEEAVEEESDEEMCLDLFG
ncbi:hypothetical protein LINGRAHAP2_LOCUS4457 [Linum grandiflorum]